MKKLLPLILILFAAPCFADFTGNWLLERCERNDDGSASYYQDDAYCIGYVAGAADILNDVSEICIDGIQYGQMRKVVEKYLRNNPELLHRNADILVRNALQKAFPCK